MSERKIIRKENRPLAFKVGIVQYIRCGKKKDPQLYTPSHKFHRQCKASHRCHE